MDEIKIYWKDLTKEMQNRLLEQWGENWNYDVIPIVTLPAELDDAPHEREIRILKVEPGQAPYEKTISNTLESIQGEVGGGLLEPVCLDDGIILCCNEEGKLNGMEMNRRVESDIICGPFFLVRDDGEGDFASLTDEQVQQYADRFAQPDQFSDYEPAAQPHMEFYTF